MDSRAILAKHGSLYPNFGKAGASSDTLDPCFALVYNLRNVSVVLRCPKYWDSLWKAW